MPVPTPVKTYTYYVNNAQASQGTNAANYQLFFYNWVTAMIAGGWTVRSSSNGTTASTSNTWSSSASIVYNTAAHSWIVLRHPTTLWDLCIDFNNSTNPNRCAIMATRSGYLQTSLVTTARPGLVVANDEVTIQASGNVGWWGETDTAIVWHYIRSSDGDVQRLLVFSQDFLVAGLFLDAVQNPISGLNGSNVNPPMYWIYSYSGSPTSNAANLTTTATWVNAVFAVRTPSTNVTSPGPIVSVYLGAEGYSGNLLTIGLTVPNDLTGEYPLLSTSLISSTSPYRGRLGTPYDLYYGVSNLALGTTYPADGTRTVMQFGYLAIPWNGSIPLTR